MTMKHFVHVILYLFFLIFFCIKNNYLPKKRGALKKHPNLFSESTLSRSYGLSQWRLYWGCRGLSFVLDLSDKIYTLVFCMVLHDIVVCLFMSWDVVWYLCFYCLLRAFPNCHSVCDQNNKYVCTHLNNMVVATMDHRYSLALGTQWQTHQLIA